MKCLNYVGLNEILNEIRKNETFIVQSGNIFIRYEGTTEDTANGKVENFTIRRKVG